MSIWVECCCTFRFPPQVKLQMLGSICDNGPTSQCLSQLEHEPCSVEEKAAKEAAKAQRRAALEAKKAAKQKNTLLNHFAVAKTVCCPGCTPTVIVSCVDCTLSQGRPQRMQPQPDL